VNVRLIPSSESEADFAWILKSMEAGVIRADANVARAVTREDEPFHRAMLEANGYKVDRLSRSWIIDLAKHGSRLLAERSRSRKSMQDEHIRLGTLVGAVAQDGWRRLYELTSATIPDIPATHPEPIPTYETWLSRMQGPDVHEDRIWTAWSDDRLVGYSYLTYPREGDVWTGYTATDRSHRRRGIARAMKLETIGQAIELGTPTIRTNNDLENSAMLHINERLWYEPLPGLVTHLKTLL
jgi:GNAT superfamily N-acetyltransferase